MMHPPPRARRADTAVGDSLTNPGPNGMRRATLKVNAIILVRVNGGETADLTSVMLKECGATDIDAR